jgi:hypothetical protein
VAHRTQCFSEILLEPISGFLAHASRCFYDKFTDIYSIGFSSNALEMKCNTFLGDAGNSLFHYKCAALV